MDSSTLRMGTAWACFRAGGGGGAKFSLRGRGGLEPENPEVCVPTTAPINISFCKISFFPTMKSGSEGGVLA